MKKLFTLLVLLLTFVSCSAQKVEQIPITKTVAKVVTIIGDEVVIQPYGSSTSYTLPKPDTLVEGWEYVFWLEVVPTNADNKRGVIIDYAVTTTQARINMDNIAKRLSQTRVIKSDKNVTRL